MFPYAAFYWIVSGFARILRSIGRSFRQLSVTGEETRRSRLSLLQIWMLLYMFVGTQMAFVLSPFVGREPEFHVLHRTSGNFYSYVWDTILDRFDGHLNPRDAKEQTQDVAAAALHALHQGGRWSALRLVFARADDTEYRLTAIIHDQSF